MLAGIVQLVLVVFASSLRADRQCENQVSCAAFESDSLNVHIVPHSHDDVGWLKTVDQYYYGRRNVVQNAAVNLILSSVVEELAKNKTRKFIYVETAFFKKWYDRQSDGVREQVRNLVRAGQLEFISGAWSMNDEATTHYQSIIDQFAWGLNYLNATFGECARPHIGWQIDPFGHSRQFAWLLSEMDYTALFLGRIDYQDKLARLIAKRMETQWKTSANSRSQLWTSVLYNTYSPPKGFCFDILCANEAIVDDPASPEYNLDARVDLFVDFVQNQSKRYRTNHVIVTMGEDFNYQDARVWYDNLDLIINELNYRKRTNGTKVNAFYSTPSCYAKGVQDAAGETGVKFPTKSDDYFPYASDPHAFWTGYFTSRPALKRYERLANNYFQICKQLYVLANVNRTFLPNINTMREAMGIMQHHDAVSGTEKQHVASDYARLLSIGFDRCTAVIQESFRLWNVTSKPIDPNLLFNISQTSRNTSDDFTLIVYNPLSRFVYRYAVRVPVTKRQFTVTDGNGTSLAYQLVAVADSVRNIPGRDGRSTHELVFQVPELAPLTYRKFRVQSQPMPELYASSLKKSHSTLPVSSAELIGTGFLGLVYDTRTGQIKQLVRNGQVSKFTQTFAQYRGMRGNNRNFLRRASGAYIFRPNGTATTIAAPIPVRFEVRQGPIVSEFHQDFGSNVTQIIKLYQNESSIEFNWLVGPIDISDGVGKEIVTKYCTDIENNGAFYTDSNGKEMLKRVRNYRPDWEVILAEKQAGNYYPITTRISIERARGAAVNLSARNAPPQRMTVVVDRAEGGSSLQDGCVELMLHRRLLDDDGFGVAEPLNESAFGKGLVVRGRHWVSFAYSDDELDAERFLQQETVLSPWVFLAEKEEGEEQEQEETKSLEPLPDSVQILSLEPWTVNRILVRFEHLFELNESRHRSQNVTVHLNATMLDAYGIRIENIAETTLDGNKIRNPNHAHEIVLEPASIRTFLLTVKRTRSPRH